MQVDWFMSQEQEASTEALAHKWDPAGQAAVARLEAFLAKVGCSANHAITQHACVQVA